ncbi:MAG: hypothetical protein U9N84_14605 [Actinomycetota bacterium]|nr:hypothetical protein [Actinomycetota bacterium]
MSERTLSTSPTAARSGFDRWVEVHWHLLGLLFPALLASILLGAVASTGYWWLWPVVLLITLPALAVVASATRQSSVTDMRGWHLR